MTIRKPAAGLAVALLAGGCSTPGPSHVYSVGRVAGVVHDRALDGADIAREVPNFVAEDETVTGFAYDPFTDHFFLRLAPGNRVRVVDRPARKIKREYTINDPRLRGGGDLAVSPRDGHLYFLTADPAELVETSRLGEFVRTITLRDRRRPSNGIAYDPANRVLFVLGDERTLDRYHLDGTPAGSAILARPVRPSLAFGESRLYAPLSDVAGMIGVFDRDGACIATLPVAANDRFIDVGPHSFLRVF